MTLTVDDPIARWLILGFGAASTASGIALLITFALRRQLQTPMMWKVVFMTVCNLGLVIRRWISAITLTRLIAGTVDCEISGLTGQFFIESNQAWYFMLTLSLLSSLGRWEWATNHPKCFLLSQHIFVWGGSLLSAIIPFAVSAYQPGLDAIACSFGTSRSWRFLDVIPPLVYTCFSIFVLIYAYFSIRPQSSSLSSDSTPTLGRKQQRALNRIVLFVIVFIVSFSPRMMVALWSVFGYDTPDELWFMQIICGIASGTLNFVVWATNPAFIRAFCRRGHSGRNQCCVPPRMSRFWCCCGPNLDSSGLLNDDDESDPSFNDFGERIDTAPLRGPGGLGSGVIGAGGGGSAFAHSQGGGGGAAFLAEDETSIRDRNPRPSIPSARDRIDALGTTPTGTTYHRPSHAGTGGSGNGSGSGSGSGSAIPTPSNHRIGGSSRSTVDRDQGLARDSSGNSIEPPSPTDQVTFPSPPPPPPPPRSPITPGMLPSSSTNSTNSNHNNGGMNNNGAIHVGSRHSGHSTLGGGTVFGASNHSLSRTATASNSNSDFAAAMAAATAAQAAAAAHAAAVAAAHAAAAQAHAAAASNSPSALGSAPPSTTVANSSSSHYNNTSEGPLTRGSSGLINILRASSSSRASVNIPIQ